MTIKAIQEELIEEFAMFDDWMQRYEYMIDLGKSLPLIDKQNKRIGFREAKIIDYNRLIKSCDIGLSSVMVKKSLLRNSLFSKLKTKEDYVLWLKLAKKKYKFYPIKTPLLYWRKLNNSLSSSSIQKLIDGYSVYRIYLKQSIIRSFLSLFILSINFLQK